MISNRTGQVNIPVLTVYHTILMEIDLRVLCVSFAISE
jgi:hypothetical protein